LCWFPNRLVGMGYRSLTGVYSLRGLPLGDAWCFPSFDDF
jgi:hypothetical protein